MHCMTLVNKTTRRCLNRTISLMPLYNFVFCCMIAKAQVVTLVMYSAKNIKYPKVIKLQFARPLD